MRLDCDICGATYVVSESQISPTIATKVSCPYCDSAKIVEPRQKSSVIAHDDLLNAAVAPAAIADGDTLDNFGAAPEDLASLNAAAVREKPRTADLTVPAPIPRAASAATAADDLMLGFSEPMTRTQVGPPPAQEPQGAKASVPRAVERVGEKKSSESIQEVVRGGRPRTVPALSRLGASVVVSDDPSAAIEPADSMAATQVFSPLQLSPDMPLPADGVPAPPAETEVKADKSSGARSPVDEEKAMQRLFESAEEEEETLAFEVQSAPPQILDRTQVHEHEMSPAKEVEEPLDLGLDEDPTPEPGVLPTVNAPPAALNDPVAALRAEAKKAEEEQGFVATRAFSSLSADELETFVQEDQVAASPPIDASLNGAVENLPSQTSFSGPLNQSPQVSPVPGLTASAGKGVLNASHEHDFTALEDSAPVFEGGLMPGVSPSTAASNPAPAVSEDDSDLFGAALPGGEEVFGGTAEEDSDLFGAALSGGEEVFGGTAEEDSDLFGAALSGGEEVFGGTAEEDSDLFGAALSGGEEVFGGTAEEDSDLFGAALSGGEEVFGGTAEEDSDLFGAALSGGEEVFGGTADEDSDLFGAASNEEAGGVGVLTPAAEGSSFGERPGVESLGLAGSPQQSISEDLFGRAESGDLFGVSAGVGGGLPPNGSNGHPPAPGTYPASSENSGFSPPPVFGYEDAGGVTNPGGAFVPPPTGLSPVVGIEEPSRESVAPPSPAPVLVKGDSAEDDPFGADVGDMASLLQSSPFPSLNDAEVSEVAQCKTCGKALLDQFDQVLGYCEEHQKASGPPPGIGQRAVPPQEEAQPPSSAAPAGFDAASSSVLSGAEPIEVLSTRAAPSTSSEPTFRPMYYDRPNPKARVRARFDFGRYLKRLVFLGVLAGLGYGGYRYQTELREVAAFVTSDKPLSARGPNPLGRKVIAWRAKHADFKGSVEGVLRSAWEQYRKDTRAGYAEAQMFFERGLVLQQDNVELIAGYVENVAIWRYATTEEGEQALLKRAVDYALSTAPGNPAVRRAAAALSWAQGLLGECRAGVDEALEKNPGDALARLLLAQCSIGGNVNLAISHVEKVAREEPDIKRAARVLAEAYSQAGRFAAAFKLLKKRLRQNPSAKSWLLYGDLARDVAEYGESEKAYKKAIRSGEDAQFAHLSLARLYLEQGALTKAERAFKEAASTGRLQGQRGAAIYRDWARLVLNQRRAAKVVDLTSRALALDSRDVASLVLRGEAALLQGNHQEASSFAKKAMNLAGQEPAVLVLAARAAASVGKKETAFKYLKKAAENEPRDPRVRVILAAMHIRFGEISEAYTTMRRAAEQDPKLADSRRYHQALGLFRPSVEEAITYFEASGSQERNESVARSAVALTYYHLGDAARARIEVKKALAADNANIGALIYDAQLALDQKQPSRALQSAKKAVRTDKSAALGHLLQGRAFKMMGRMRDAEKSYANAVRLNAGLIGAKAELASLRVRGKGRKAALKTLVDAYNMDSSSLLIRRVMRKSGL